MIVQGLSQQSLYILDPFIKKIFKFAVPLFVPSRPKRQFTACQGEREAKLPCAIRYNDPQLTIKGHGGDGRQRGVWGRFLQVSTLKSR